MKQNAFLVSMLVVPFGWCTASRVMAATDSATFQVTIEIQAACEIAATNDLDFGTHGVLSSFVDSATTVDVQCTNTTPYSLRLSQGVGIGASVASRLMTGPGGATIAYSLYSDAGRTVVWGDTPLVDAVAGVGTGSVQSYQIYGRVPAQATPGSGQFADTVTATVEF
jgi:spore coat protein U-like protein